MVVLMHYESMATPHLVQTSFSCNTFAHFDNNPIAIDSNTKELYGSYAWELGKISAMSLVLTLVILTNISR